MTIHLPDELQSSIRPFLSNGQFASETDLVATALAEYLQRHLPQEVAPEPSSERTESADRKPIWDRLIELSEGVPDEEWAKLPDDGAAQVDHYLHGAPKRPTS